MGEHTLAHIPIPLTCILEFPLRKSVRARGAWRFRDSRLSLHGSSRIRRQIGPRSFFPTVLPLARLRVWEASRAVRQYNMVVSPVGLGSKNDCTGKGQQQFSSQQSISQSHRFQFTEHWLFYCPLWAANSIDKYPISNKYNWSLSTNVNLYINQKGMWSLEIVSIRLLVCDLVRAPKTLDVFLCLIRYKILSLKADG
jgi:hypothetical protein